MLEKLIEVIGNLLEKIPIDKILEKLPMEKIYEKVPLDKLWEKSDKIFQFLPVDKEQFIVLCVIGLIGLWLLFLYYDKTIELIKDNFIKWDTTCFFRLTFLMFIPLIAYWSMEITFTSDVYLNSWINLFLITLILPIIPYILLIAYRLLFLLIKFIFIGIIHFIKSLKEENAEDTDNIENIDDTDNLITELMEDVIEELKVDVENASKDIKEV